MARTSLIASIAFTLLVGACAETGDSPSQDAGPSVGYDAAASGYDASRPATPGTPPPTTPIPVTPVTSTPRPSTPVTSTPGPSTPGPSDGGVRSPLDDIDFGSLLGDGGGGGGQTGELDPNGEVNPKLPPKKDNPPECPSLAPPNPVGNCLGLPIYVICGYGAEGGQQYTCTCDWYHWLCA
jgi:hypothetical protein